MPPLKGVSTLGVLANNQVSKDIASACSRVEERTVDGPANEKMRVDLSQTLTELPTNLLENIILTTTNLLTKQVDLYRNTLGLTTAIQLLPQPAVSQLDFGQLFTGARLSRSMNTSCRAALRSSLARNEN